MTVHFFEPPPWQKIGGLELAIRSLENFLIRAGVTVRKDTPTAELRGGDSELVHFHGLWQPKFLRISAACRRQGVPYIVSPHGMLEPWAWRQKWWKKWPWFHLFERGHIASARRLLATSETEARNLAKFFPDSQPLALPLGLTSSRQPDYTAAREALGWGDSELILLFLSRVHPKKGLHLLLHALGNLDRTLHHHARLVVVGGGKKEYLRKLQGLVEREKERLPRVDCVRETWGDDKWTYFQGADLFCLPSFSENFGLAVLEALQVGTRVLTTNQTPWHAIPCWKAGWLVEPNVGSVEAALSEYFAHPEWTAEQRARLADKIHRDFAWEQVGPSYLSLYDQVAVSRSTSRHKASDAKALQE